METTNRRKFLRIGTGMALTGLAGCGSSGDGETTTTPSDQEETPTSSPQIDETEEPAEETTTTEPAEETSTPEPTTNPGELLWETEVGVTGSRPAVLDDVVYVGSFDKNIYAINAESGSKRWNVGTERQANKPVAVGADVVYGHTNGGEILALEPDDGTERWRWSAPEEAQVGSGSSGPIYSMGNLIADEDSVYVAASDLFALSAKNGSVQWQQNPGEGVGLTPAYEDETVFAAHQGRLFAYAASDGTLKWDADPEITNLPTASPAADNNTVVYGSGEKMFAFNSADGTQKWSITRTDADFEMVDVAGETVYAVNKPFGGEPTLHAFSASDGTEQWTYSSEFSKAKFPPAVTSESVYIGTGDFETTVIALSAEDGTAAWTFTRDHQLGSSPVIDGESVYIGTSDALFAIQS